MVSSSNSVVHRSVASSSIDDVDSHAGPSSISSLPMYTSELDSAAPISSGSRGSTMNEKSSDAYGFDYETSSPLIRFRQRRFSSKQKTSSFLNLPIFSYAFKGNGRRQPFGLKHGNDFAKSVKRKSPTFWITGLLAFCIVVYPIYSLLNTSSGFKPVTGLSDSTILTSIHSSIQISII